MDEAITTQWKKVSQHLFFEQPTGASEEETSEPGTLYEEPGDQLEE